MVYTYNVCALTLDQWPEKGILVDIVLDEQKMPGVSITQTRTAIAKENSHFVLSMVTSRT